MGDEAVVGRSGLGPSRCPAGHPRAPSRTRQAPLGIDPPGAPGFESPLEGGPFSLVVPLSRAEAYGHECHSIARVLPLLSAGLPARADAVLARAMGPGTGGGQRRSLPAGSYAALGGNGD